MSNAQTESLWRKAFNGLFVLSGTIGVIFLPQDLSGFGGAICVPALWVSAMCRDGLLIIYTVILTCWILGQNSLPIFRHFYKKVSPVDFDAVGSRQEVNDFGINHGGIKDCIILSIPCSFRKNFPLTTVGMSARSYQFNGALTETDLPGHNWLAKQEQPYYKGDDDLFDIIYIPKDQYAVGYYGDRKVEGSYRVSSGSAHIIQIGRKWGQDKFEAC